MEDLKKFVDKFPYDVIPHIMKIQQGSEEVEIVNDVIHNYRGTSQASKLHE